MPSVDELLEKAELNLQDLEDETFSLWSDSKNVTMYILN